MKSNVLTTFQIHAETVALGILVEEAVKVTAIFVIGTIHIQMTAVIENCYFNN